MRSKCINIHDPKSRLYELTDEYDGQRAVPKTFFMLLESYQNHPEAKSLGPDGQPCESDTRGLLQRAHIVANWPPIYIGKESDKHWEEGEDFSLLEFKTIEYKRTGYAIATDEQLKQIAKIPKREFMRRGINQHTLEKICGREPVRASKLAHCLKVLEEVDVVPASRPFQLPCSQRIVLDIYDRGVYGADAQRRRRSLSFFSAQHDPTEPVPKSAKSSE